MLESIHTIIIPKGNSVIFVEKITGMGISIKLKNQFEIEGKSVTLVDISHRQSFKVLSTKVDVIIIDEPRSIRIEELNKWLSAAYNVQIFILQCKNLYDKYENRPIFKEIL